MCQSNGNLLASAGVDGIVDKRESKIVNAFGDVHSCKMNSILPKVYSIIENFVGSANVYCVRWNPSGDELATPLLIKQQAWWISRPVKLFRLEPLQMEVN